MSINGPEMKRPSVINQVVVTSTAVNKRKITKTQITFLI